jgi:hypothetical protein
MENIKVEYMGFEISYREDREIWSCEVASAHYEKQTLKECKKKIDDFLKKEKSFERYPAYKKSWNAGLIQIDITSVCSDDPKYYWTITKDGKNNREKTRKDNLFQMNTENTNIVNSITQIELDISKLEKEKKELFNKLVVIN